MNKFLLIILFTGSCIFAQTDWEKWEAAEISYELPAVPKKDYTFNTDNFGSLFLSGLKNVYYFTFSDLDGDNCPFHPTCSNFFVSAVKETNIFQGTLMFADRFTRDSNLFKTRTNYPYINSGKLYDPVNNYLLDANRIQK
jgi:putative component of membrane protein insertase Oxa1/YidC/SpoIIIJ protein YidD